MQIETLDPTHLAAWCQRLDIPSAGCAALLDVAHAIQATPALQTFFEDFYQQTTLEGRWRREWSAFPTDPVVDQALGERASLFYLLGYMAALPRAEQEYHRRGISMEIFHDTMRDITFYLLEDTDAAGFWRFNHFPWIWRHLTCELFRLGRLQFMLLPFPHGVLALRSKPEGSPEGPRYLLLAAPEQPLREDGSAEGAGGKPDGQPVWTPYLEERPDGWRGFPISPYGRAVKKEVFLPQEGWEVVLRRGDTVLDIHIPRGKTLHAEEIRDSFARAAAFFAAQRPDASIRASYCHTWFFTPQLQALLPPESSIVRFQREFYLYPFPGGPSFLWTFVFGEKVTDPISAPRDTALRRAVLDWMASGQELYDLPGLRFHPAEAWGKQPYMRAWDNGRMPEW